MLFYNANHVLLTDMTTLIIDYRTYILSLMFDPVYTSFGFIHKVLIQSNGNSVIRPSIGAQWVARLTRDRWIPVSREFEPHQRPPLFP